MPTPGAGSGAVRILSAPMNHAVEWWTRGMVENVGNPERSERIRADAANELPADSVARVGAGFVDRDLHAALAERDAERGSRRGLLRRW